MDKGKGKGKGKDKGKPIIAPATSTTTSEDMDVQEEAPARGSKRSASPPTVGNTTAPSSVCGPGSATKKRRTSLARNTTSQMNQNTHIEESLAEADENDESKEPSPQKRRRVGSPQGSRKLSKPSSHPRII